MIINLNLKYLKVVEVVEEVVVVEVEPEEEVEVLIEVVEVLVEEVVEVEVIIEEDQITIEEEIQEISEDNINY